MASTSRWANTVLTSLHNTFSTKPIPVSFSTSEHFSCMDNCCQLSLFLSLVHHDNIIVIQPYLTYSAEVNMLKTWHILLAGWLKQLSFFRTTSVKASSCLVLTLNQVILVQLRKTSKHGEIQYLASPSGPCAKFSTMSKNTTDNACTWLLTLTWKETHT